MSVKPTVDSAKQAGQKPAGAAAPVQQKKVSAGVGSAPSSLQPAPAKKPEDKPVNSSGLKHSVYYDSYL